MGKAGPFLTEEPERFAPSWLPTVDQLSFWYNQVGAPNIHGSMIEFFLAVDDDDDGDGVLDEDEDDGDDEL